MYKLDPFKVIGLSKWLFALLLYIVREISARILSQANPGYKGISSS